LYIMTVDGMFWQICYDIRQFYDLSMILSNQRGDV
jgi:hypothetical protein